VGLGVTEIADHYEGLIRQLDQPPVLLGPPSAAWSSPA
jgi:hypothetical protein